MKISSKIDIGLLIKLVTLYTTTSIAILFLLRREVLRSQISTVIAGAGFILYIFIKILRITIAEDQVVVQSKKVVNKLSLYENRYIILVGSLVIIGFYLRMKNIGRLGYNIDESFHVLAARGILETGLPILKFDRGLYYRGSTVSYLVSLSHLLFGESELASRIPSALVGSLGIYVVYLVASLQINKKTGIIAAVLFSFNLWVVYFSRISRMYIYIPLFYLLISLVLVRLVRQINTSRINMKTGTFFILISVSAFFTHRLIILSTLSILVYSYVMLENINPSIIKRNKYVLSCFVILCLCTYVFTPISVNTVFSIPGFELSVQGVKNLISFNSLVYYIAWYSENFPIITIASAASLPIMYVKDRQCLPYFVAWLWIPTVIILPLGITASPRYTFIIFPLHLVAASYTIYILYDSVISYGLPLSSRKGPRQLLSVIIVAVILLNTPMVGANSNLTNSGEITDNVVSSTYCDQYSGQYLSHLRWPEYKNAIYPHIKQNDSVIVQNKFRYRVYFDMRETGMTNDGMRLRREVNNRIENKGDVWVIMINRPSNDMQTIIEDNNMYPLTNNVCGRLIIYTTNEAASEDINEKLSRDE